MQRKRKNKKEKMDKIINKETRMMKTRKTQFQISIIQ